MPADKTSTHTAGATSSAPNATLSDRLRTMRKRVPRTRPRPAILWDSIMRVLLTLPIREVRPATPRARIVRIDLAGATFPYRPGQAVLVASHGYEYRRPYSMAAAHDDAQQEDCLELLIGIDVTGHPGVHLALEPGAMVDVDGPVGTFTFPDRPDERSFLFVAGGTGIAPL